MATTLAIVFALSFIVMLFVNNQTGKDMRSAQDCASLMMQAKIAIEVELTKAHGMLDSLMKITTNPIDRDRFVIAFAGTVAPVMMDAMCQWFRDVKGVNLVECYIANSTGTEEYTMTMQRKHGKTPLQLHNELLTMLAPFIQPDGHLDVPEGSEAMRHLTERLALCDGTRVAR